MLVSMCLSVFCFFFFSDKLLQMLPTYWVTVAILHLSTILQMLGPLMVVTFFCPGANAMPSE